VRVKFHTHNITPPGSFIRDISRIEVHWTFAVRTQADRTSRVVDDDITRPTCTVTKPIVWTRAAVHTVGLTWLTTARSIGVCRLRTLCYAVRAVLEVTAGVARICALQTERPVMSAKNINRHTEKHTGAQLQLLMTVIYKPDPHSLGIYWMDENELPTSRLSKVIILRIYRQTDRHD